MTTLPLPCPHGMPNAATCTQCMDEGPVAAPSRWEKVGPPFAATYAGVCVGCDRADIRVGEQIQRWDRGEDTRYLHDGCRP